LKVKIIFLHFWNEMLILSTPFLPAYEISAKVNTGKQ
jgi:hypothetical protein